jgi:CheY-like chemotaxis protein
MSPTHDAFCRILIADFDSDTRQLYREWLRPLGCDVIDAVDGRDALVSALIHRPGLVITDTRLPVFSGYELCELLRRDSQARSVPILVVTGESQKPAMDRARDAGADAVLVKPVTPEGLLADALRLVRRVPNTHRRSDTPANVASAALSRFTLAKVHRRFETTTNPPILPPPLRCPGCDRALRYEQSYISGVKNDREQWDNYKCQCGTFEYRPRTRKLRRLGT